MHKRIRGQVLDLSQRLISFNKVFARALRIPYQKCFYQVFDRVILQFHRLSKKVRYCIHEARAGFALERCEAQIDPRNGSFGRLAGGPLRRHKEIGRSDTFYFPKLKRRLNPPLLSLYSPVFNQG